MIRSADAKTTGDPSLWVAASDEMLATRQWEEAAAVCRTALEDHPDSASALNDLGLALRGLGRREEALAAFRAAAEAEKGNPWRLASVASELRDLGRLDEAESVYREALRGDPDLAPAHNGLGLIHRARGERDLALTAFELAVKADPGNPSLRHSVASELHALGRHNDAIFIFRGLAADHPNFAPAHYGLGAALRDVGEKSEALEAFEAALASEPKNGWYRASAAAVLHELGRVDEAIEAYRAAIELEPRLASARNGLGQIYRLRGQNGAALAEFLAAVELEPENPWLRSAVATELDALGHSQQAVAEYARVLAHNPTFAPARNGLGHIHRRNGAHALALAEFEAASAAEPKNPWFRNAVAGELHALGRDEDSLRAFRQSLIIDPHFAAAHNGLAQVLRQLGERAEALAEFEAAVASEPDNPYFRTGLATALQDLDRFDDAIACFGEALALQPGFGPALNGLAIVYRAQGEHEQALRAFRAAADAEPANPWRLCDIAGELQALGRTNEAIAMFRSALDKRSGFGPAHNGLGLVRRHNGELVEALGEFEAAVTAEPDNPWYRNSVSATLRELGRLDEAEGVARDNVAKRPKDPTPLLELAACLKTRGQLPLAIDRLRQAVALDPKDAGLKCRLGLELLGIQDLDEADGIFTEVLRERPNFIDARIGKGLIARQRGDRQLAKSHFEAACTLGFSIWAFRELAQEQLYFDEIEEARSALAAILRVQPTQRDVQMQLGYLERACGRHDEALKAFRGVALHHPRFVAAHVEAAREEFSAGRPTNAFASLKDALGINPTDVGALETLASLLRITNRETDALAVFRLAGALHPQLWMALQVACGEARLGRLDRALTIMHGASARFGELPETRLVKAGLLQDAGFHEQARREITDGLVSFPRAFLLMRERAAIAIGAGDQAAAIASTNALEPFGAKEKADVKWLRSLLSAEEFDFAAAARLAADAAAEDLSDVSRLNFAARSALLAFQVDDADRLLSAHAARNRSVSSLQGAPTGKAQSHLGHLIAEWRLDRYALARTTSALNVEGSERIDRLKRVVAEFRDYTPAAIALFIELRRQGMLPSLADSGLKGGRRKIPRTIIQFWDEAVAPPDVAQICETWSLNNFGFGHIVFSTSSAHEYLESRHDADVLGAFLRAREPAQKADIFRLAYLYVEGGYYADADDRCVAPIELIDPGGRGLVLYQEDVGAVANSFIGAAPNDPIIGSALRQAVEAVNRGDGDVLWLSTGPGLLTRVLAAFTADHDTDIFSGEAGPIILSRRELFRSVRIHCSASYKQTRKNWGRANLALRGAGHDRDLDELLKMVGVQTPPRSIGDR